MRVYMYHAALFCDRCAIPIMKQLTFDCGICGGRHPDIPAVDCRAFHQKDRRHFWDPPSAPYDSDDFPKGPFPNGGGEADSPQHCDDCGRFLMNPLTPEGYAHVRDRLDAYAEHGMGRLDVLSVWAHFYGFQMPYKYR